MELLYYKEILDNISDWSIYAILIAPQEIFV